MDFAGIKAGFVSVLRSPDPVLVFWVALQGSGACPALPHPYPHTSPLAAVLSAYSVTSSPHCPLVGLELGGGGLARKEECSSGSSEVPSALSAFILRTRSQELPVVLGCTLQCVSGLELVRLGVCCCPCLAALGEESAWLGGHSHF